MIDRLVAFALHKRVVVWMVCLFLAAYGYYSWTQLPLEAYPDIADVTSQVVTLAARPGGGRSRAADHHPARTRAQRNSGPAGDALEKHFRTVADHPRVSRWIGGLLVATAHSGAHPERDFAAWNHIQPRPVDIADWRNLPVHARIRHEGPARAFRDPTLDGYSCAQAGAGGRRRYQFWRHHNAVPA